MVGVKSVVRFSVACKSSNNSGSTESVEIEQVSNKVIGVNEGDVKSKQDKGNQGNPNTIIVKDVKPTETSLTDLDPLFIKMTAFEEKLDLLVANSKKVDEIIEPQVIEVDGYVPKNNSYNASVSIGSTFFGKLNLNKGGLKYVNTYNFRYRSIDKKTSVVVGPNKPKLMNETVNSNFFTSKITVDILKSLEWNNKINLRKRVFDNDSEIAKEKKKEPELNNYKIKGAIEDTLLSSYYKVDILDNLKKYKPNHNYIYNKFSLGLFHHIFKKHVDCDIEGLIFTNDATYNVVDLSNDPRLTTQSMKDNLNSENVFWVIGKNKSTIIKIMVYLCRNNPIVTKDGKIYSNIANNTKCLIPREVIVYTDDVLETNRIISSIDKDYYCNEQNFLNLLADVFELNDLGKTSDLINSNIKSNFLLTEILKENIPSISKPNIEEFHIPIMFGLYTRNIEESSVVNFKHFLTQSYFLEAMVFKQNVISLLNYCIFQLLQKTVNINQIGDTRYLATQFTKIMKNFKNGLESSDILEDLFSNMGVTYCSDYRHYFGTSIYDYITRNIELQVDEENNISLFGINGLLSISCLISDPTKSIKSTVSDVMRGNVAIELIKKTNNIFINNHSVYEFLANVCDQILTNSIKDVEWKRWLTPSNIVNEHKIQNENILEWDSQEQYIVIVTQTGMKFRDKAKPIRIISVINEIDENENTDGNINDIVDIFDKKPDLGDEEKYEQKMLTSGLIGEPILIAPQQEYIPHQPSLKSSDYVTNVENRIINEPIVSIEVRPYMSFTKSGDGYIDISYSPDGGSKKDDIIKHGVNESKLVRLVGDYRENKPIEKRKKDKLDSAMLNLTTYVKMTWIHCYIKNLSFDETTEKNNCLNDTIINLVKQSDIKNKDEVIKLVSKNTNRSVERLYYLVELLNLPVIIYNVVDEKGDRIKATRFKSNKVPRHIIMYYQCANHVSILTDEGYKNLDRMIRIKNQFYEEHPNDKYLWYSILSHAKRFGSSNFTNILGSDAFRYEDQKRNRNIL